MDAHRLRSVIDLIIAEHRRLEVYQQLTWIQQKLDDCTANPCSESDEQFRSALTGLLTELRGTAINDLVESDRRILSRIEGDRVAGTGLAERALEIANERPFLPARAKATFAKLAAEVENRVQALSATQTGLRELNVDPVRRDADSWELGILLPQRLIAGDIEKLLGELQDWNRIVKELVPLFTTGSAPVSLRTYSSECFELAVPLDRDGALALGVAVARVYEMFHKVRDNRQRAEELEKQSYPSDIVGRLTAYEQQLVGQQMKAIKEELKKRHVRRGAGKPKEVDKLLDKGLRFLAVRIREGVEVEIAGPRAATEPAAESGPEPVTHHVRAALHAARLAKPTAAPDKKQDKKRASRPDKKPDEQQAAPEAEPPRLPLSKITEESEGEKKAA
ncbi:MAG: hypothetical protein ACYTEI_02265 [Planctomycetota bacterium]|jgi:hypothetical protein